MTRARLHIAPPAADRPPDESAGGMRRQPTFGRIRHVHMVGIGGIGMSSIAEVLLRRGYRVTGSDLALSDTTRTLEEHGAVIHEGHAAEQVGDAHVVVYSSAVRPGENPETIRASEDHIPLIPRSEMLGELMRMKFGIGIAGTHGKTTTTSMAGVVVKAGGFDPTVIVGGKVADFGSNAVSGAGDIIVIEADEYDRTFLRLTPSVAVVTNIELDHMDIYPDLDDVKDAFVRYVNSVPFFGAAVLCLDDANVRSILNRVDRRVVTYGTVRQARIRAEQIEQSGRTMRFDVFDGDTRLGEASVNAPGRHNVLNALATIAVGLELDMEFDAIKKGLASWSGVQRRMHEIGEPGGVLVVDDYAHHPTEVKATLEAAAGCWPDRRILAVFQPHLYSRTETFASEFGEALLGADVVFVMDVYGAREAPIEGVTGRLVADHAESFGHRNVTYVSDKEALPESVVAATRPGDVVLTLGAGDIWRSNRAIHDLLSAAEGSA